MWTLLKAAADWEAHKGEMSKTLGVAPTRITWGNDPATYPCLACTLLPPRPANTDPRAYTAFVYETDCEELFKASGRKMLNQDAPVPQTQAQFNRWVAAELLTIVHFMVETGLCARGGVKAGETAFESKLTEMIDLVDQYQGDKKKELRAMLSSYATTVLDTLEPPK